MMKYMLKYGQCYFEYIHVPILMKTKFQSMKLEYVLLYTITNNPTFEFLIMV